MVSAAEDWHLVFEMADYVFKVTCAAVHTHIWSHIHTDTHTHTHTHAVTVGQVNGSALSKLSGLFCGLPRIKSKVALGFDPCRLTRISLLLTNTEANKTQTSNIICNTNPCIGFQWRFLMSPDGDECAVALFQSQDIYIWIFYMVLLRESGSQLRFYPQYSDKEYQCQACQFEYQIAGEEVQNSFTIRHSAFGSWTEIQDTLISLSKILIFILKSSTSDDVNLIYESEGLVKNWHFWSVFNLERDWKIYFLTNLTYKCLNSYNTIWFWQSLIILLVCRASWQILLLAEKNVSNDHDFELIYWISIVFYIFLFMDA